MTFSRTVLIWGVWAASAVALGGPPALASGQTLEGLDGWQRVEVPGKPATEFVPSDGAIRVSADSSVAFLVRELTAEEAAMPPLSWRWRVDLANPVTDLSAKGGDDRPLAVHVWFPPDPDAESLFSQFRRDMAGLFGMPLPGRAVTYVWGGHGERGQMIENPYFQGSGVLVTLRPGAAPTGRWFAESVDPVADYERAFGTPAPTPTHVAVSADTDDTMSRSLAWIADLVFGISGASTGAHDDG